MEGFVVVANAQAGAAGKGIASARDELTRSGEVEVVDLVEPRTLDEVLDRLAGRALVIAGGDGTINAIVQRLWDRRALDATVIGLLPLGTGNDFARCLQIPLTPIGSAATSRHSPVESQGWLDVVERLHRCRPLSRRSVRRY